MPMQDEAKHNITHSIIDSVTNSTTNFNPFATPTWSSTARIPRVPRMVTKIHDYEKNYVPKVVSIGPYHFQNPKLESVEKLKPTVAMLLLKNKETMRSLCEELGEPETVKELRNYHEEGSTTAYCDEVFTKMMLLDGCFILFHINLFIHGRESEYFRVGLNRNEIAFVHQDLFLLENQIPFKVLWKVMMVLLYPASEMKRYMDGLIFAYGKPKRNWLGFYIYRIQKQSEPGLEEYKRELIDKEPDHLLHLLHRSLTKTTKPTISGSRYLNKYTLCNVNELMYAGIQFKPSDSMSLAHIEFYKAPGVGFSASLELSPIFVDDSTMSMMLNLIAYEMGLHDKLNAWVTSYLWYLASLIDIPDDVKVLRKAMVLATSLDDEEIVKFLKEMTTYLVPNEHAYVEAQNKIQRHCEKWTNTLILQFHNEYVISLNAYINHPWKIYAILGAVMSLFLSGVQTYFTVWSPKRE